MTGDLDVGKTVTLYTISAMASPSNIVGVSTYVQDIASGTCTLF